MFQEANDPMYAQLNKALQEGRSKADFYCEVRAYVFDIKQDCLMAVLLGSDFYIILCDSVVL